MLPNPQDALQLPPRPRLEQYRKLAKDLVKACKSSEPEAIAAWAAQWLERLARLLGHKVTARLRAAVLRSGHVVQDFAHHKMGTTCTLSDAQFIIARLHGFESWPKLAKHIEGLARRSSPIARFEEAAEAIVAGDLPTLKRLLGESPQLARARSTRQHRATLLHYVSANGVENYRQKSPRNAVKIAGLLLEAGAEVDAEADVYGGGSTTLGLVATSIHPEQAGVQNALLQTLLDHGAAIDHPQGAGNNHDPVKGCLANGRGKAAEFLAARGASLTLETAAGVGRLDVVKQLQPHATKEQMNVGFLWACRYGRNSVVSFLLDRGADLNAQDRDGQTGLHGAAFGGHPDTLQLLLERKPPLEVRNVYGGTVLGQAVWSAAHGRDPDVFAQIIETLIAAGAKVPERHPPVNRRIDALLRRHGSRADSSLSWYREKPRRPRVK